MSETDRDQGREAGIDRALKFDAGVAVGDFRFDARFEVNPGPPTVLIGPNGSGKSTCLKLIAGLLRPDRGSVTLGGNVLSDAAAGLSLAPSRRRVGVLFQDYALFPHLTVRENISFGPRMAFKRRAEREKIVDRWLGRLGIEVLAGAEVSSLSGGEKQKVALARALAAEPRCLLLDEPFRSLDVSASMSVRRELREFLAEVAIPVLIVTHDPMDALILGESIVVLEGGEISQMGRLRDLLRQPRTGFVAEFTGLNLFQAALEPGTGLKSAAAGPLEFHVIADSLSGEVCLTFAPADVTLFHAWPEGSPRNVFRGAITEVLPLHDRVRVTIDAGLPIRAEVTREAAASLHMVPGEVLCAAVKAIAIHVYK